ncbi:MAG: hypothetical protein MN733_30320 [Nitrososphaera sp.]|nr:hypothetical protein [Nitrososphaera sp.]
MAVAYDADAQSAQINNTTNTVTWSHTVTGDDPLLLVYVAIDGADTATVSTVTYNSVSLSSQAGLEHGNERLELWSLVNPATGANDVVVTLTENAHFRGSAISFTGVHQTTPLDTPVTAAAQAESTSVDVSSATDDMVVNCVTVDSTIDENTPGASQTVRWSDLWYSNLDRFMGSTAPGAATVTMSWDWTGANVDFVHIAVNINAAAVAAGWGHLLSDTRNRLIYVPH